MNSKASAWKRVGGLGARCFLAVLVVMGVGEGIARVFITTPSNQQFDAALGWVYEPNSTIFSSREGGTLLQLNELGFNDKESPTQDTQEPIIFLGDSMTEALQVRQEANFTSVLERLDPKLDAINWGRSAMGPAHYGVVLDRYAANVQARWTLVVLSPGDLLDLLRDNVNVTRDAKNNIETIALRPASTDRFKATLGPILRRSALVTHLARRLKPVVSATIRNWICKIRDCEAVSLTTEFNQAYAEQEQEEAAARLQFTLAKLQKKGALAVLHIPALKYGASGHVEQTFPWEGAIYAQVAQTLGIPYLDTTEALTHAYQTTGQPPHGFANAVMGTGHLNEAGHEAVGHAIHRWLTSTPEPRRGSP